MLIVLPGSDSVSPLTELHWVQSRDGLHPIHQGQDPVALLPAETDVVLAVPAPLLSWHWVELPATSSNRLRQVLDGMLEDRLLAEPDSLHLSLQPGLAPRQAGWICACDKAWLDGWVQVLQFAGRRLVRIVPEATPQAEATQGLWTALGRSWRVETGPRGVCCLPLATPDDASSALPRPAAGAGSHATSAPAVWHAEPALAGLAEQLGNGNPVSLQTVGQRLLAASQGSWDLAQFDLRQSAGIRQGQRMLQGLRALGFGPAWRWTRLGVLAGVGLTAMGLLVAAWQAQHQIDQQTQRIRQLLTQTFPSVTLVLDAPLQMQREVERLQRASGVAAAGDLEVFLTDFSASSPVNMGLSALFLENGTFTVTLQAAPESALLALQEGLLQRGWQAHLQAGTLTVRRTAPGSGQTTRVVPARGDRP